ncbi:MAG: hypothetical protein KDC80_08785 [Saprospiraceae bacterium]|nr:hypothetical protein [Saprospiraceae bacterium]
MKNLFLLIALFLGGGLALSAQSEGDQDVIFLYLKKGMTLEGKVVELSPGESITILTAYGHTIKVPDRKIKRYYYPQNQKVDVLSLGEKKYGFKEQGLYQYATLGLIMNTVNSESGGAVGFQMTAAMGYQINRWIGAGIGGSADFYRTGASEMVFPVFTELRGYFLEENSTPYYILRTGYGFASANEQDVHEAKGGWMINPAVGWRLGGGKGLKMTFDVGVQFQHAEFNYSRGAESSITDIVYKRLNMRLGFLF